MANIEMCLPGEEPLSPDSRSPGGGALAYVRKMSKMQLQPPIIRQYEESIKRPATRQPPFANSSMLQKVRIFCSYSESDEDYLKKLEMHLRLLQRQHGIDPWHKGCIAPGEDWAKETRRQLEAADMVLLLISNDFLASDSCYHIEMERAVQRHDEGKARVIPILVRSADWQSSSFGKLQVLPSNRQPVKKWSDEDDAWLDIKLGIERVLKELKE